MNIYSITEIYKKYNLSYANGGGIATKIHALELRGIFLEEIKTKYKKKRFFKIKDDSLFFQEWVPHPFYNNLELTKNGFFRNKETKVIFKKHVNANGYEEVYIGNNLIKRVHRLLMETFNPIENSENYVVDHIDGVRTNNQLTNLRWVSLNSNNQLKDINHTQIGIEITRLIQKYGYEELIKKLQIL